MVVVAVITLGVAMKAEDVVELALARGRLALDVFLLTSFRGGQLAAQLNGDSQPKSALSPALPSPQGPSRPAEWLVDPGRPWRTLWPIRPGP